MAGRRDAEARPVMPALPPRAMPDDLARLYVLEATIETLKAENEILTPAGRRRDVGGAGGDHKTARYAGGQAPAQAASRFSRPVPAIRLTPAIKLRVPKARQQDAAYQKSDAKVGPLRSSLYQRTDDRSRLEAGMTLTGKEERRSLGSLWGFASRGNPHMKTTLLVGALATRALLNLAPPAVLPTSLAPAIPGLRLTHSLYLPPSPFSLFSAMPRSQAIWSIPRTFLKLSPAIRAMFLAQAISISLSWLSNDGFHNLAGVTASSLAGFKTDVGYFSDFPGSHLAPSTDRRRRRSVSTFLTVYRGSRIPLSWLSRRTLRDFLIRFLARLGSVRAAQPLRAPSVPEPSTWAMMALGFGLLGLLGYRKSMQRQRFGVSRRAIHPTHRSGP